MKKSDIAILVFIGFLVGIAFGMYWRSVQVEPRLRAEIARLEARIQE